MKKKKKQKLYTHTAFYVELLHCSYLGFKLFKLTISFQAIFFDFFLSFFFGLLQTSLLACIIYSVSSIDDQNEMRVTTEKEKETLSNKQLEQTKRRSILFQLDSIHFNHSFQLSIIIKKQSSYDEIYAIFLKLKRTSIPTRTHINTYRTVM